MTKTLLAMAAMAVLASCGSDDSGAKANVSTSGATTTTSSATGLRTAFTTAMGMGNSVATAVQNLASQAQASVSPSTGSMTAMGLTLEPAQTTGTCTCTATGCTYTMCGGNGYTMDGSIMFASDTYTIALTNKITTGTVNYDYTYKGTLTITATELKGEFHANGKGTIGAAGLSYDQTYGTDVFFNDVKLDAQGCAIGGNVKIQSTYKVSGGALTGVAGGGAGNYSGGGTVTFGPNCGDAKQS